MNEFNLEDFSKSLKIIGVDTLNKFNNILKGNYN